MAFFLAALIFEGVKRVSAKGRQCFDLAVRRRLRYFLLQSMNSVCSKSASHSSVDRGKAKLSEVSGAIKRIVEYRSRCNRQGYAAKAS